MDNWEKRITVDQNHRGGQPCIRGMQIRVIDVLDLLAAGVPQQQLFQELPDLEPEDIKAALSYASQKLSSRSDFQKRSWDRSFLELADVDREVI